jgi:hypothetical protein
VSDDPAAVSTVRPSGEKSEGGEVGRLRRTGNDAARRAVGQGQHAQVPALVDQHQSLALLALLGVVEGPQVLDIAAERAVVLARQLAAVLERPGPQDVVAPR